MKSLLVTGGAGFIGSNFIRHILNTHPDYRIINLDKLTYCGNLNNLKDVQQSKSYKFIKGDICDPKTVEQAMKGCDFVINFAAESITGDTCLPIWTIPGIKIYSLEELFKNLSRKNKIKSYSNGVEVINLRNKNIKTLSYKGGIGYWMPVIQISRHKYKGKIIRLNQKWGEIEATPNHSIYDTDFNVTSPDSNPELLGLRNINHISKKETHSFYKGRKLQALVLILGAYVSEGWSSFNKANGCYQVGIANKNIKWINSLKDNFRLLGYNPSVTKTKRDLYQLVISHKDFFNFVRREAGYGHNNKKIPDFIFNLKKFYQEHFLKNMIFGDGEVIENKNYKTIRYTTTSKRTAVGLSLLLSLLKYNYSLVRDKKFNAYTLCFGGDYTVSLLNKNYEEFYYEGYVYDISVEKLHNFVCGVGNIVVHNTHVDRSIKSSLEFIRTNVSGVQVLLDTAKKLKVKRVLHISTDEVYGDVKRGLSKEDDPLLPNSPYAATKAAADLLCRAYFKTYKFPIVIARSSNNFGPYQYPEKIMPLFITNAIEDKPLPLYGDGRNMRDWIYVVDNCSAIDLVLHKGRPGEVYNIGGGNQIRNIKIAKEILAMMGKDKEMISFVTDRPGHDRRYALDSTKIKELGWESEYDFKRALKLTIEWYLSNEWWWRPLKRKAKIIKW